MLVSQASVLSPAEGEQYRAGPFDIQARVLGSQTAGVFEFYELALGPGVTVDYHIHRNMDETLYVVEGKIEFLVAGERFVRPPGSVAFVPRGVHHGFANVGPTRARVLALFNPASKQDEYFRGWSACSPLPAWTRRPCKSFRSGTTKSWSAWPESKEHAEGGPVSEAGPRATGAPMPSPRWGGLWNRIGFRGASDRRRARLGTVPALPVRPSRDPEFRSEA